MFHGIGSLNQLFAGFGRGNAHHSHHPASNGQSVSVSQYSLSVEYSSVEMSFSSQGSAGGQRQFSAQVFETRLSGRLSAFQQPAQNPYQSALPSPQDVANKVLGFVEQRIAQEAENGATPEELEDLFAQATEGVSTGYAEAIEEIETRGLMTDELQSDIDEGYDLIQTGLTDLREKYLPGDPQGVEDGAVIVDPAQTESAPEDEVVQNSQANDEGEVVADSDDGDASGAVSSNSEQDRPRLSRLAEAFAYNRTQLTSNDLGLTVTTRDGDKVTIYVGAASGSQTSALYAARGGNQYLGVSQSSFETSGYQLLVDGELDQDELTALEEMLAQVEDIAGSFFAGDFNDAFAAALEMDVDMSEIASYSVSMSSMQYEEVEAAYRSGGRHSANQFQPLADQVPKYADALSQAARFDEPASLIEQIMERLVEFNGESEQLQNDQFLDFSRQLLQQLSA
ncbi:hypothetical protein BTA51_13110 [Hahella sp. CCB-MM4]|uniref:DUF5610 domain-containing protein n=1 Tax=Hahella sp. (strain CCB-MM4) TaxID=1926491 RepID=UPI000B9B3832|nr:DUF5610 domain-containing protein [Hahella sp. CCB-MM4]OZG72900.1 hypothetical protein BTA51_13110 [Hahella sp. CCB-MM4]